MGPGVRFFSATSPHRTWHLDQRRVTLEKRYRAQYVVLGTMIVNMIATSTFLIQQLAAMAVNI